MSRLNDLIKELCPDGVEYKKIKDIYTHLKGTPITAGKMKEIARDNGEIRIFAGGKTVINANEEDIQKANITRVPSVLVQSRGIIDVVYYDKPFTFKSEMWAYTADNIVEVKFLYYVLKNNIEFFRVLAYGRSSIPQISLSITENFKIPFPPLEIQSEIVRILDSFTEYISLLENEFKLRDIQYFYYRNTLIKSRENIESVILKDIVTVSRGIRVVRKQLETTGNIPVYQNSMKPLGYYEKSNCKSNTAFVIGAGSAGEIGFSSVEFWAADDCYYFVCSEKVLDKFLYYSLLCHYNFLKSQVRKASIPRLARSVIENLKIYLPSVEEQKRIVSILDLFEKYSCLRKNELELRKKQYKYYRNKLLEFKIKNN